jgi:hypothetical protein
LLKLEPADRYLRFGYAANDEQIRRYAEQLDFSRDEIFGIYNRRLELIAMAHLAFSEHPSTSNAPSLASRCSSRPVAVVWATACSSGLSCTPAMLV